MLIKNMSDKIKCFFEKYKNKYKNKNTRTTEIKIEIKCGKIQILHEGKYCGDHYSIEVIADKFLKNIQDIVNIITELEKNNKNKTDDNEIIHEGLDKLYGNKENQKKNMKFLENAENQKYTNNNQTHYKQGGIEPITFILANNLNFAEGNIVKYITRHKYKDGLKDLEKARDYLNILILEYKEGKK